MSPTPASAREGEMMEERDELARRLTNALKTIKALVEWRPIETAPRDGSWLLMWGGYAPPMPVKWSTNSRYPTGEGWVGFDFDPYDIEGDINWLPLPLPPQSLTIPADLVSCMTSPDSSPAGEGMVELIAKLEAASEGSRDLDTEIFLALNPGWERHPQVPHQVVDPVRGLRTQVWLYTSSLDHAISLMPEGTLWDVTSSGLAWAMPRDDIDAMQQARAQTPALALCIAALKARQATILPTAA